MSSETARARRSLLLLVAVTALAIALLRGLGGLPRNAAETPPATLPAEEVVETPLPPVGPPTGTEAPIAASGEAGDAFEPEAFAWAQVDLDAVRAELPHNMFWEMSAPTSDERLLRDREDTRAEWNRQFGRVQANLATAQEIRDYYALRQRISADAVEFSSHLLDHYGSVLPERDVGLLELARKLHLARLEEMPARLAEALERREQHEAKRAKWLADEQAFSGSEPTAR